MKKKITSTFCFPGELDMSRRLSKHSQSELIYDLSAVLIHKGSAVNSGHYVAHIKDEDTDQWWEFDDELVSKLGRHPFGGDSSNLTAKSVKTGPVVESSFPESKDDAVNGNHMDIGELHSSSPDDVSHVQTFSSTDAYMLMYSLRLPKNSDEKTQMESGGKKLEKDGNTVSPQNDASLPSHLLEEVTQLNMSYLYSCQQYRTKKESELNRITERRQEVRSVISEAPAQSLGEPYFWISTDWLRHWADNIVSFTIDNAPIQCLHGKVPVSKVGSIKRLSAKAWTMLFSKHDGGPKLAKDDYCVDCLLEMACTMVSADSYRDGRTSMRGLAEAALAGKCLDGTLYYVSRTWLQQWVRRKKIGSPCEADAGPTAAIRCTHGELMPEQASGARRTLVPENLWIFFYETANAIKPDDISGCSVFPSNSEPCALCSVELTEVTCLEDSLRDFKLKQRQYHEKLALGKSLTLHPCIRYYLLPSSWLSNWRNYINAGGKNATSAEPETLNSVINLMKCEQHSKLLERPPDLVWKRGAILQKVPTADGLTIISENDWKLFCKDWDGMEDKGISAEIVFSKYLEDSPLGTSEEMPISEVNMNSLDEVNGGAEPPGPVIKTCPEVCEDCIHERESCELVRKLNYCDENICVCFVHGKEPPKLCLEASGKILEPNRRTSKRSRKTPFEDSINLNVSGSTSIYQLKMMIWQSFGVVKENQILHKGSKIIDGESATLADLNIFPGDILWVTDSKIHENRDIADELSDQKMEVQKAEEGFRGTLLTSNISSQFVSEACFN